VEGSLAIVAVVADYPFLFYGGRDCGQEESRQEGPEEGCQESQEEGFPQGPRFAQGLSQEG
jgi:hypothetical protein